MYQSEGTGRERKGEISQRRKQNEIIIITILAVIMTAVMFANILENPKISDQSANEKEKMEKISNKTKTDVAGTTIELVPKGFNKAVGISAVCRLFDIPWEDTIVFGDSNNDLAMFEYAAVKVAMGNGSEKIKALADHITQDMFHYGIRNGLEYLKLI